MKERSSYFFVHRACTGEPPKVTMVEEERVEETFLFVIPLAHKLSSRFTGKN